MQKQSIEFEYFHGYESEQFAFYRVPKVLFTNPYFRELSSDAKILYGLMLDRMALSIRNHWIDEEDRVYIIFTLEQIMEYLNCGKDKGVKILAELDSEKGIGLIERVKQGLGRPTLIYVKSFIIKEAMESEQSADDQEPAVQNCRQTEGEEAEVKTSEKPKSGVRKIRSQDFGKTEVKSSENQKSGLRENRSQEFGFSDANNTDNNKTEYSKTDSINLSTQRYDREPMGMDAIDVYADIVKSNIEYDLLMQRYGPGDRQYIDEIVDLMVETISIPRQYVLIGGSEYPYQLVKGRLLKVDSGHIQYVMECLHRNTSKVFNIRAYLLTCIYNAPSTINSYFRAEVNHDMYGLGG